MYWQKSRTAFYGFFNMRNKTSIKGNKFTILIREHSFGIPTENMVQVGTYPF